MWSHSIFEQTLAFDWDLPYFPSVFIVIFSSLLLKCATEANSGWTAKSCGRIFCSVSLMVFPFAFTYCEVPNITVKLEGIILHDATSQLFSDTSVARRSLLCCCCAPSVSMMIHSCHMWYFQWFTSIHTLSPALLYNPPFYQQLHLITHERNKKNWTEW